MPGIQRQNNSTADQTYAKAKPRVETNPIPDVFHTELFLLF
jgi:hypothetical protein